MVWNHTAERVDAVSELLYDELVIQESRGAVPDPELAADAARGEGDGGRIERFVDMDALE